MPMLERVFLHIGVEKTGTKTLQRTMARNRDLLRQHGFVYPTLPGLQHVGLALYAANERATSDMRAFAGLSERDRCGEFIDQFPAALTAAVTGPGAHTAILSNEHCSSRLSTVAELARLREVIAPLARECRVIVYLRRQDELAASCYSEDMQAGLTEPFEFVDGAFWFDYEKLLDMWAAVFDADHLVIRPFEPAQLRNGDLLDDFCHCLGFAHAAQMERPPDQNRSLDVHTLEFLRRINACLPVFADGRVNRDRGPIGRALAAISDGDRLAPPAAAAMAFLQKFEASNRTVAAKYLHRRDGKLFANEPGFDRPERLPSLDTDQAIEIAAKLWLWQEARFRERADE